mmetsp:Transcript_7993/g.26632  ORF Transcript_7993/g.26632 Transcript_7993/m.26632 type:complete len:378 (+) Transcript_7993:132-1265(+)
MGKSDKKDKKNKKGKHVSPMDMDDVPMGLPDELQRQKTRATCNKDFVNNASGHQYSGAYMTLDNDNSLNLEKFKTDFRIEVKALDEESIVFDMVGIDAAIANAFRRILIAEVPTMAIEKVFIANNTSIIQDEVLAHRLGMIPIRADPRDFSFKTEEATASENNTIVMRLNVRCVRDKADKTKVVNKEVLTSQMEWLPRGSEYPPDQEKKYTTFQRTQEEMFQDSPIACVHDDVVIAKMRPGQEIELEAHCVKGIGATHAKWSPVATASYRMLPEVEFLQPVEGGEAAELVATCPQKVFDIEDLGSKKVAVAARPRDCTLCRECIRKEGWEEKVRLQRKRDHFIFSIESSGVLPPEVLFTEAVQILSRKAEKVMDKIM